MLCSQLVDVNDMHLFAPNCLSSTASAAHLCSSCLCLIARNPQLPSLNVQCHQPILLPPVLLLQQQVAVLQLLQLLLEHTFHAAIDSTALLLWLRGTGTTRLLHRICCYCCGICRSC
jgi:hypothetical protein